jgi:hypothetical protein
VIAPAEPSMPVRGSQQGIDFGSREECDQSPRETLAGNGNRG